MRNALKPQAVTQYTGALETCLLESLCISRPSITASARCISSSTTVAQQNLHHGGKSQQGGASAQQSLRTAVAFATFAGMGIAYHHITTSKATPQKVHEDVASRTPSNGASGQQSDDPLVGMLMNAQPHHQRDKLPGSKAGEHAPPSSGGDINSQGPVETVAALTSKPWLVTEAWTEKLHSRALAENRLRGYLHVKQREVQTWLDQMQMMRRVSEEEFEKEMRRVEDEVNLQTNIIMYGIHDANSRRDYLSQYGCTKWSEEALKEIARHGQIIEIGAGLGHWQAALSAKGVNVLSFDNMSALPMPDVRTVKPTFAGKVEKGDESVIKKHSRRTLLLVYPGPDDMAVKAVQSYKGDTLLYVGEPVGGVNATQAFFEELREHWEVVRTSPVEPFPEGYEQLWVMKRKKQKGSKGWLW